MNLQGEARLDYYDSSRHLGSVRKYLCGCTEGGESHSGYFPNLAYFCIECGEIWARGVYTYEFEYQPLPTGKWRTLERPCIIHGGGLLIDLTPGESLTDPRLEAFSPELLLREFHILLSYYGGSGNAKRESQESLRRD